MNINVEVNIAFIMSLLALLSSLVSSIVFIMRLRWDIGRQQEEINQGKLDINALGAKVDKSIEILTEKIAEQRVMDTNELRHMVIRVDAMDKAIIGLSLKMEFISDTVKALKETLCKNTAIL